MYEMTVEAGGGSYMEMPVCLIGMGMRSLHQLRILQTVLHSFPCRYSPVIIALEQPQTFNNALSVLRFLFFYFFLL